MSLLGPGLVPLGRMHANAADRMHKRISNLWSTRYTLQL